jgi:hypothetical protein
VLREKSLLWVFVVITVFGIALRPDLQPQGKLPPDNFAWLILNVHFFGGALVGWQGDRPETRTIVGITTN